MFDGEYRVALLPMQENQASSRGEGEFSWFSRVAVGTWGVFSSYDGDVPETFVYSYIRLLLKCLWKVGIPLE